MAGAISDNSEDEEKRVSDLGTIYHEEIRGQHNSSYYSPNGDFFGKLDYCLFCFFVLMKVFDLQTSKVLTRLTHHGISNGKAQGLKKLTDRQSMLT